MRLIWAWCVNREEKKEKNRKIENLKIDQPFLQ